MLEVYFDLFNVFNAQTQSSVDEEYTRDYVNPIVGGTYQDLIWAKAVGNTGGETSTPIIRNPNFGNVAGRYSPLMVRVGFKLTF